MSATAALERADAREVETSRPAAAARAPAAGPPLLRVQRTAGNAAVQRALEVVPSGDPLEREAEAFASGSGVHRCTCGGVVGPDGLCSRCRALGVALARRGPSRPAGDVRAVVAGVLGRPGIPLDAAARSSFEPRLGADLGAVRLHTDAEADRSARVLGARAYTVGTDIAFAAGERSQSLLAHELAHVVQQGSGRTGAAVVQRQEGSGAGSSTSTRFVPRPPGLPIDQGFLLQPVAPEMQALFANLPDGQVVPLTLSRVDIGTPRGPGIDWGGALGGLPGGGTGLLTSINAQLMTQGFRSAGPNAIVLLAKPQLPGPLGLFSWGHTGVGVRVGGELQGIRGFNPQLGELLPSFGDVYSGTRGVPGEFTGDIGMFKSTSAMSLEIPVTEEVARQTLGQLPQAGRTGALYTARPSVMKLCAGENCVLFAVRRAESAVGGEIGPVLPSGQAVSVADIARRSGGLGVEADTASQGVLMRFMQQVEAGEVATALPEGAVASAMPTGLRVMKWGGRAMIVVGAATVPLEVYLAKPEERTRTAVGATAGFLGGLGAGAAAGLVCGPGAPVCSVVLGIGFGIAGGIAARSTAEEVYDLGAGRPVNPVFETIRDIYTGRAWESFEQYMTMSRWGPYGASFPR